MPDELAHIVGGPPLPDPSLFESTSLAAGRVAAKFAGQRYREILAVLAESHACIFEVAARIGLHDHQISGRFGELVKAGLILRTGHTRRTPGGRCEAHLYTITTLGLAYKNTSIDPYLNPVQKGIE